MSRRLAVLITAASIVGGGCAYAQERNPGPGTLDVTVICAAKSSRGPLRDILRSKSSARLNRNASSSVQHGTVPVTQDTTRN
jgi:hypothetical protein